MNYRKQHLAGITIIEVLFSVGIIVTGLLGVAGLIMIAGSQMTQGLEADAMSNARELDCLYHYTSGSNGYGLPESFFFSVQSTA